MSDRGDESFAAPSSSGAPTGPLPGPRPPTSGWPQTPPQSYRGPGVPPPTPSQTTGAFGSPAYPPGNQTTAVSSPPYGGPGPTPGGPGYASGGPGYASGGPGYASGPGFESGGPGSPLPPRRPSDRRSAPRSLAIGSFLLTLILLVVVIVQTVMLAGLSGDVDKARTAQTRAESAASKDREDVGNLTKRIQALEERTEGTLNSTAVAKKVLPSVFSVRAGQATGTAFAFGKAPNGGTLLITNYHVVDSLVSSGGKNATIQRESETYQVTIDRTDKQRDLAVLRTTAKFEPLKPAKVAVEPGDPVIVVGAPLGLTDTVTTGVVSAVRDDVEGLNTRVIQFDAAINPGNSGGPVINAESEVVGIAQAKIIAEGADGLGLAIPINEVCKGLISC
ncbi:trypsin-like peptidase domain-containing protein [Cryptosporangium sp. NPDC051539]|uniref:S1C family serine protease n=1 Tax=Cryptosporangium sp. NPDC051539 TaxID=3363962 RepID=UPI0037A2FDE3